MNNFLIERDARNSKEHKCRQLRDLQISFHALLPHIEIVRVIRCSVKLDVVFFHGADTLTSPLVFISIATEKRIENNLLQF